MQYVHFRSHFDDFLFPWKLADNQCSSITKGSIYYINYVHTTFKHGSGLTWNFIFVGPYILHFYFGGRFVGTIQPLF